MYINGQHLLRAAPIKDMVGTKVNYAGVSFGLTELGYDIRIKQEVIFEPGYHGQYDSWAADLKSGVGRFCLASTIEEFQMPSNMGAEVKDKSTWARKGLSVFNTVIEPGWNGFLTLELVYHGREQLYIPAGAGIAQVLFQKTSEEAFYAGKYQNQENEPVPARMATISNRQQGKTAAMADWSSELVLPDTRPVQRQQPDPTKRGFTPN